MVKPSHAVVYARITTLGIVRVRGRYRVGKPLGSGAFGKFLQGDHIICDIQIHIGSVYLGKDIKTERDVALKLQAAEDLSSNLAHEYSIYQAISGLPGIPKVYWYGREGPYYVIVLDRLGSTLEEIGQTSIDINAAFAYATQMVFLSLSFMHLCLCLCLCLSKLLILESLHDRHYVHLDVKPDNFVIGIGELSKQVFLIDFGLAQLFRDPATHSHTMQTDGSNVLGTICYSSINCHLGLPPSPRDDLESLVYVIVYLAKGSLPWQGITVQPGQSYEDEVLKLKQATTVKALCEGLPRPFVEFVEHIRSLEFQDKPDYKYLCVTPCVAFSQ
jgi:serine/threonine protein kinase